MGTIEQLYRPNTHLYATNIRCGGAAPAVRKRAPCGSQLGCTPRTYERRELCSLCGDHHWVETR